jgi:hypothetical protein
MQPPEPAGEYTSPATVTIPAGSDSAPVQVTGVSSGFGALEATLGLNRAQDTFRIGTGF